MRTAPDSLSHYEALYAYSSTYSYVNQFDTALPQCRRVLDFCGRQPKSSRVYELMASSNNMIGNYHNQLNSPDSAILFYQKALKNFQLLRKKEAVPDIMINLADMYTIKGNYAQSVYYFRKALILSDSLNLTKKMGFPIYFGLGRVYMELRDFELSDSYFRLAEKYYGNRALREKFVFCNNRGNYYYYKEEFPQALYWCQKAMSLLKGGDFPFFLALDEINLADIYLNMGKLDSSQYYLKRGEAYFSNQQNQTAQYYINTIKIGLALKQNKLSQVHELLKKEVPPVAIDLNMVTIRNKYLEDYYAKMGDFRMAYHYQARNRILNDSIRADRTFKRTAELDMRYKLNKTVLKKDQLINNQVAQLEDLRLTQFIWILVCVLVLTVAFFTYIFMKRQRDLQRLKHMDQVTKLRMRNIRNQISPHFVLNVLNREIVSVEESRRNGLYGLAKLLRESLEMTGQASVSLAKELEFVETYIELERGALGPEFRLNWEIDSQIDQHQTQVPPMMVQIPVENAIKHALRPKTGDKILHLRVSLEKKGIRIIIQDNGAGYYPGQVSASRGTGTGMNVLYQTVHLLNSKNVEKIDLQIQNIEDPKNGGARMTIFIPEAYTFE